MPNVISALTARTQFGQIIDRASQDQTRFIVEKRGEPVVVIMGLKDFIDTIAPTPEVLDRISDRSKRLGTDKMTLSQINREIKVARTELAKATTKR